MKVGRIGEMEEYCKNLGMWDQKDSIECVVRGFEVRGGLTTTR